MGICRFWAFLGHTSTTCNEWSTSADWTQLVCYKVRVGRKLLFKYWWKNFSFIFELWWKGGFMPLCSFKWGMINDRLRAWRYIQRPLLRFGAPLCCTFWNSWLTQKHRLHETEVVYPLSFGRWQYLTPNSLQQLLGLVSKDPKGSDVWVVCLEIKAGIHTQVIPQLVHQDDGTCNSSLYRADMLKFCFKKRNCFPFSCMPSWTTVPNSPPSAVGSLVGCIFPQYLTLGIWQKYSS